MTDAGAFERLATAVLRRADSACAGLVHSGVNADGRPVPAAVDGFMVLGEQPSDYVVCAHTTMALPRLRGKWLDPNEGDIAKAAASARSVGAVGGRLVLTTNREPSLELVAAARDACTAQGLRLDLWPQSRFADFLDDDAEGQAIRRRFFGEPETRLSFSYLRAIGEAGTTDVALFDAPEALVPRMAAEQVATRLLSGHQIILLNAASGQGKTVVALEVWRRMVSAGAGAVHVAHDDVDASVSLEEALTRALRRRSSALSAECGREACELSARHDLLVLVEDINRSARPDAALRKIVGWSRQAKATGLRILCPIWPRALAALSDQERKAIGASVVWLDLPSEDEAIEMARAQAVSQGFHPTPHDLLRIVRSLACDPLLLSAHDYSGRSSDGLKAYVSREVGRVAANAGLAGADLHESLDVLAKTMLRERVLEPRWRDVRAWVPSDAASHLLRLIHDGALLRLSGDGPAERVLFRHDRVRDQIRASAAIDLLETESTSAVLDEPAYAELWGLVLGDPSTPDDWIQIAATRNPLGLFLGLAGCPATASGRRAALAAAGAAWLKADAHSKLNEHLRWAAQFALAQVDGPEVRPLLPLFGETTWMIREAAFLNGDMEAGLRITAAWNGFRLRGREEHLFNHVRTSRAEEARAFVRAGLADPNAGPERLAALLVMAGRLRDPALETALAQAWMRLPPTPQFIDAMMWAFALCTPHRLPDVLDAWAALSDEREEDGRTPRGRVGVDSRTGLWELAGPDALAEFLTKGRERDDALFWHISYLLEGWDHPDAQEYLARHMASTVGMGFHSTVVSHAGEMWGDDEARGGWVMSAASQQRLQALWMDETEHIEVRRMALRIWSGAARPHQVEPLRSIDLDGPLGLAAVRARIMLRDPEGPPALDSVMEADPTHGWLWYQVRGRWQDAYLYVIERHLTHRRELKASNELGKFRADHALPEILREVEDDLRTRLLTRHWDHLGDDYVWVQLALWTATPGSLELAQQSLATHEPEKLLNFLSMHYGLYRQSRPPTDDIRRVEALEPWLDYLNQGCLSQLAEHCNRMGWRTWRRAHLDARLVGSNRPAWGTAEARRAEFDKAAGEEERPPFLRIAVEHMLEAEGSAVTIFAEADAWLRGRPDLAALRVACGLVIETGARTDLSWFENWRLLGVEGGDQVIGDAVFAVKRRTLD